MQNIKLTVVGDSSVGKTCLLLTYTTNAFPGEYIPTIMDQYSANVMVDGRPINLECTDTNGSEDYDRLRPLSYNGTGVFLLCFAVNNQSSLDNIRNKWLPELAHHRPGVPYILCGLKCDLRNDINLDSSTFVSSEEANRVCLEIGASKYMEISSLTSNNLKSVFDEAVRLVLNNNNNNRDIRLDLNNNNGQQRQRRSFKCECDWKEVLNQTWQIFAFLVAITVYILIDIWALFISYNQYHTNDECWNELNILWMHPRIFLIVGGLSSIIGVGLGMIAKVLCGIDEEQQDVPRLCMLCFFFVWAIIGYVISAQIASINQCDGQSIGKMCIAWSIVKNIEFCCGSLDILVNAYKFHFMN